jgi:NAD(P)-dependent dehydrogenase (short-subunit alcohol dehydrogenase family)
VTDYRKLFDLGGKTAVVLGAASGIGKSSAEALAALGARVMCPDRSGEGAKPPPPAFGRRAVGRTQRAATRPMPPTSRRSR